MGTGLELRTVNLVVESQDRIRMTGDKFGIGLFALCGRCANGITGAGFKLHQKHVSVEGRVRMDGNILEIPDYQLLLPDIRCLANEVVVTSVR